VAGELTSAGVTGSNVLALVAIFRGDHCAGVSSRTQFAGRGSHTVYVDIALFHELAELGQALGGVYFGHVDGTEGSRDVEGAGGGTGVKSGCTSCCCRVCAQQEAWQKHRSAYLRDTSDPASEGSCSWTRAWRALAPPAADSGSTPAKPHGSISSGTVSRLARHSVGRRIAFSCQQSPTRHAIVSSTFACETLHHSWLVNAILPPNTNTNHQPRYVPREFFPCWFHTTNHIPDMSAHVVCLFCFCLSCVCFFPRLSSRLHHSSRHALALHLIDRQAMTFTLTQHNLLSPPTQTFTSTADHLSQCSGYHHPP
jgi:hypothetical protein